MTKIIEGLKAAGVYIGKVLSEKDGTPSSIRWGMLLSLVTICFVIFHAALTHTEVGANLRDLLIWLGGFALGGKVGSKPFEGSKAQ